MPCFHDLCASLCMNVIQGTKASLRQWNRLLDAVVTINKYNKSTIDHSIYIKVLSGGTLSYLIVFTGDVLNTTNKAAFSELRNVFKNTLEESKIKLYP